MPADAPQMHTAPGCTEVVGVAAPPSSLGDGCGSTQLRLGDGCGSTHHHQGARSAACSLSDVGAVV